MIKSIRTTKGVSVFVAGKPPVTIDASAANYEEVLRCIEDNDEEGLDRAINVRQTIVEKSFGAFNINSRGVLSYGDYPVPAALNEYVLPILKKSGNVLPLTNFLENLLKNPRTFAINELLQFIEYCDLPITNDGHFLAYKKVRLDYRDCHSGTMDNSVGNIVEMPRFAVDDDRTNTCSAGLHFCSKGYLNSFGGERIVVVKINPADVVSIPVDYNFSKGRTWRYEVVAELNTLDGELVSELEPYWIGDFANSADDDDDFVLELSTSNGQGAKSYKKVAVKNDNPIGKTSLTDDQVRRIRKLLNEGLTLTDIASDIGTSRKTVARIRDGETYRDVV